MMGTTLINFIARRNEMVDFDRIFKPKISSRLPWCSRTYDHLLLARLATTLLTGSYPGLDSGMSLQAWMLRNECDRMCRTLKVTGQGPIHHSVIRCDWCLCVLVIPHHKNCCPPKALEWIGQYYHFVASV